jgi:hypothetical protein
VYLSLEAGLAGADEYAVEHVHSWMRRATTDWSPAESVRQAGCLLSQDRASSAFAAIYGSKEARRNKVSNLTAQSIRAGQYWVALFDKMLRRYQAKQVATIIRSPKNNTRTGYRWPTHDIDAKEHFIRPPTHSNKKYVIRMMNLRN